MRWSREPAQLKMSGGGRSLAETHLWQLFPLTGKLSPPAEIFGRKPSDYAAFNEKGRFGTGNK
jgi:hypothetical protein